MTAKVLRLDHYRPRRRRLHSPAWFVLASMMLAILVIIVGALYLGEILIRLFSLLV